MDLEVYIKSKAGSAGAYVYVLHVQGCACKKPRRLLDTVKVEVAEDAYPAFFKAHPEWPRREGDWDYKENKRGPRDSRRWGVCVLKLPFGQLLRLRLEEGWPS